jgi:hypothetical protein
MSWDVMGIHADIAHCFGCPASTMNGLLELMNTLNTFSGRTLKAFVVGMLPKTHFEPELLSHGNQVV